MVTPTSQAGPQPTTTFPVTSTSTPTTAPVSTEPSATAIPATEHLTIVVATIHPEITKYDRDEWRHWTDEDGDCQDARQEVLIEESEVPVTYEDSRECRVVSGKWTGLYTGEEFTDPKDLDIDHMVPLANAHGSDGWAWSEDEKRSYANDLSYRGHLIAVKASANRSKGSKGPEEWKPPNNGYWCQYAIDWITVKNTWELTANEAEATSLGEMLQTCVPTLSLTVQASAGQVPEETPAATETSQESYISCEAAETAGEPRVLGSNGDGRGFPQQKVQSARDGDGDGVVCEQ